ncbi:hypothetical protein O9929_24620 [Vibrio lentus]|nr:hypothetical protein [Vibrio lentus]
MASSLWNIRELHLSLITDMNSGAISDDDVRTKRDALQTILCTSSIKDLQTPM